MENYVAKRHWWYWTGPIALSIVLCWTFVLPIFILGYAFLRWKADTLEIKDGFLQSKKGVIFLDKKTIPIEQISFISEKTDIIAQSMGFGTIQIQSSAFAKTIDYLFISNPGEFIKRVNEYKNK